MDGKEYTDEQVLANQDLGQKQHRIANNSSVRKTSQQQIMGSA